MNRRLFLSLGMSSIFLFERKSDKVIVGEGKKLLRGGAPGKADLINCLIGDKVDTRIDYLRNCSKSESKSQKFSEYLNSYVLNLPVPKNGKIVEMGVWRANNFDILNQHFGSERCIGYDIFPYVERPNLVIKDVRKLTQMDDMPIALSYSDVSDWKTSFASKKAALEFLCRNTVPGGFIIDSCLDRIPNNIEIRGFRLVDSFKTTMILQKI